jgi:hypothetical protein
MKLIISLILLSLFCSCSSTPKYSYYPPYGNLELKVVSFIDANEQSFITRQYYLNTKEIYKGHIESRQINNLKKWSCFGNTESVNYLNIIKDEIPVFRTLATQQKFTIKYKKVDATRDLAHTRIYTEEKKDQISITRKTCFLKDENNRVTTVISELYSNN